MKLFAKLQPGSWKSHRRSILVLALLGWVTVVGASYWKSHNLGARTAVAAGLVKAEFIKVGGLPVTCNLSLPIACMAMENDAAGGMAMDHGSMDHGSMDMPGALKLAEYQKFSGWPELKEAIMSGRIQAGYLLAPMVMDLADNGIPVKIVALGHRSGAVVMVHNDNPARNFGDLRGKRVAIPSRFAVDHLFVRKLMEQYGVRDGEVELVEMPPPDMPSALHSGAVDAYATGEPWGASAEIDGFARPLHMTRESWPDYICCVLAVREELIKSDPATVQKMVNYVLSTGTWLESNPDHRDKAADVASGMKFFGQSPKLLKFALTQPTDRVTYGDLRLLRNEMDELMRLSVHHKVLKREVAFDKYVDDSFIRNFRPVNINIDQKGAATNDK